MERTTITLRRIVSLTEKLNENPGAFSEEQKQQVQNALALLTEVYAERCAEAVERSRLT